MTLLRIRYDNKEKTVSREDYERAKLRHLREFGYPKLTLAEVQEQIDALLAKKEFRDGLTVIGMFMEDEVVEQIEGGK